MRWAPGDVTMLDLKSLTYVSIARDGLSARELANIHCVSMHLNALDGITGLLVFNGKRFMQILEGVDSAIDELVTRLLADQRHHDLDIHDERVIEERCFPDWSMELLCVSTDFAAARTALIQKLPDGLPPEVIEAVYMVARELSDDPASPLNGAMPERSRPDPSSG